MSPPEAVLWEALRARRLGGLKFRRQHPLGSYIADFYCAAARLVVEIDGASHDSRVAEDRARDAQMRAQGLHVLRFPASAVSSSATAVLRTIRSVADDRIAALNSGREGGMGTRRTYEAQ